MTNKWGKHRLGDFTKKIGKGVRPKGGKKAYKNKGIPLIRSQNIYNNYFEFDQLVYIDENTAEKMEDGKILKDDILLNTSGNSVARTTIIPEELVGGRVNQHVSIIRPEKEKINAMFLKYYLVSPKVQAYLLSLAKQGKSKIALTDKKLRETEIMVPDMEEQKKIASILSALDNRIELKNKMQKILKEIPQAIFKHWFVKFEFPDKNRRPYKSNGGRFKHSELGPIPEGWAVIKLKQIADLKMGSSHDNNFYNYEGEGPPLLTGASNFQGKLIRSNKFTTDPKRVCKAGDLILCTRSKYGNVAYADKAYCLGRGVAAITPKAEEYKEIIYYNLALSINKLMSGASGRLSKSNIENITIILPDDNLLNKFNKCVVSVRSKISNNHSEHRILSQLRNTLLPKLVSGEIRVV
jgi:type I restriction enzyme S subunit